MKKKRVNRRLPVATLALGLLLVGGATTSVLGATGDVAITEANFPDENFRDYLKSLESSKASSGGSYEWDDEKGYSVWVPDEDNVFVADEIFTAAEIAEITSMNPSDEEIKDLKGIEYFTALTSLNCSYNSLTSLDVSKNTKLKTLRCYSNKLTSLDVSGNTKLKTLNCYSNELTSLDVSKNTKLETLYCESNDLTSLDVSKNTKLETLDCSSNRLTSLDVSRNTKLENLSCSSNSLSSLSVSGMTNLVTLSCYSNGLTSLDVSGDTELSDLDCSSNKLTSLNVSGDTALKYLYCSSNKLTSLDVSENKKLITLSCSNNRLASLDVSNNTKLTYLYCGTNDLTSLDVSNNTKLETLDCSDNSLTSLNLIDNEDLETLDCSKNTGLTTVYVSSDSSITNKNATKDKSTEIVSHEHVGTLQAGTAATCGKAGVKAYYLCTCGSAYEDKDCTKKISDLATWKVIAATGNHTTTTTTTKATLKANGSVKTVCSVCGTVTSETAISYPKTIKLSKTAYTYSGKAKKPSVKVTDAAGKTVASSNYTVKYASGRKNVGKYTVTVTFKGNYSGTKKLTFKINPKGTSISKVSAGKKKLTVKWKKQTKQTTGYQVRYSLKKSMKSSKTVTVKKAKTTSKVIKSLKAKKKYYVQVRTYKTVSGKKYYSSWSKAKTATTKK